MIREVAKLWLAFVLGLTIGTLTAYGYYSDNPYEGISCGDCPKVFKDRPNRREECRACCSSQRPTDESRKNCLGECDKLPQP
ncbi:MAG: hypothetical protein RMK89_08050 [Armatimonadota bacterium]|nr:hypothetical protein [Armatimonadota bacterium]MDW8143397.1 hypothetical protein [Armatimonadota bacterium]